MALAGFALLAVIWGTQFLVIREGLGAMPPLTSAALRFLVVLAVAQALLVARRPQAHLRAGVRSPSPASTRGWRVLLGLSHAASMALIYVAQARLPSALTGVLLGLSPVLIAITAHRFVPGERLERRVIAASTLGLCGTAVIALASATGVRGADALGIAAAIGAAVTGTVTRLVSKRLTRLVAPAALVRDLGLAVPLVLGPLALAWEGPAEDHFTAASVGAFLYLGVVASAGASWLYLTLLRRHAVTRVANLQFAVAAVALVAGVTLGGEALGAGQVAGALLILGGLLLLR